MQTDGKDEPLVWSITHHRCPEMEWEPSSRKIGKNLVSLFLVQSKVRLGIRYYAIDYCDPEKRKDYMFLAQNAEVLVVTRPLGHYFTQLLHRVCVI